MKPNLDNIPLFENIPPADRQKIEDRLHLERVRQGERIYSRGDGSDVLYVIETGWAKLIDAEGMVVANLGPGALLGETEILTGTFREWEAEAASDMSVWALDAVDLDEIVAESLDLGLALNKFAGYKVAPFIRYLVEERLQPVPFLYELDYDALAEVAKRLTLERYQPGSFLFHRGGWARAIFIIEGGNVNLIASEPGGRLNTVVLNPGDVIGEVALLTAKPYTFTAEVESNAAVWALGREDFERLCEQYPSIRLILSRSMFMSPRLSDKNIAMEYLRNVPLFASLPDEALKAVAQRLILRHVPQGELVYAEGSPGEALYIIDDGEVEVISSANKDHQVLGRLRDGEYFGEASLLTGRTRSSAVRAVANTNLWALYRSDFDELMVQFQSVRQALGHTLEQELSGSGRRLTTIDGEVLESSADRSGQIERLDSGNSRNLRALSPLSAAIGRVGGTEPKTSSPSVSAGRARVHDEAPAPQVQRQTTQVFAASPQGMDALEREFVPSRQREEFIRSKAVAEREPVTGHKPGTTTTQKAVSPRGALRQETVAQDMLPLSQRRPRETVQPAPTEKRTGCSPVGAARWVANLSFLGKVRLLGLILIFVWLCGITAPTTMLWGVSALGEGWDIELFPGLFAGQNPAEAAPTATFAVAGNSSSADGEGETAGIPLPTDTPVPTNTPVPTDTAQPTATPAPPTDTPVLTDTPIPPTATPDRRATVSSTVVWVRGGPSADFKAVAKAEEGDKLTVLGRNEDGTWLHVELEDGTVGWAEAKYIESDLDIANLKAVEAPATPTPRPTEPPTEVPVSDTPTPEGTPTPEIKYTAPVQTAPDDGFMWGNGPLAKNYLEWESLDIASDEFYNVTIIYKKNGEEQYFGDFSMEPRYLLPEGLYDIADQHWYEWRVVVRQITSTTSEGRPDGPAISPESGLRRFKWD